MILLPNFTDVSVVVLGLGKSGLSTVESLVASGARQIFEWDDNQKVIQKTNNLYPTVHFIDPKEINWGQITKLVVSPGIPVNPAHAPSHWVVKLATENSVPLTSDIELLYDEQKRNGAEVKFVCVTGTNGKSTTTSLIGHILGCAKMDVAVGGNIGVPALSLEPGKKIYVLELSSFQINLLGDSFRADVGVLLNVTPDHLEVHGNLQNYADVKEKLIRSSKFAVIGCDNKISASIYENLVGAKMGIWGQPKTEPGKGVFIKGNHVYEDGVKKVNIENVGVGIVRENIAASFAVAKHFGVADKVIEGALETFKGLKHRLELVGRIGHVTFVNDTKGTNVGSAEVALRVYGEDKNIYWIVGGQTKGCRVMEDLVERECLKFLNKIFLIGESTDEFAAILKDQKQSVEFFKCYHLQAAFELAFKLAGMEERRVVILLAPGCASLDQWKNAEERGDTFCNLVQNLKLVN